MRYLWIISFLMITSGLQASDTLEVLVKGTGADALFEPAVVQVVPGTVIRFVVVEGLHTVTAYHPSNRRELGIPEEAQPFDSGILTSGKVWTLEIKKEGVYDYFCLPHERLGHAGRIISGENISITSIGTTMGSRPAKVIATLNRETKKLINQINK